MPKYFTFFKTIFKNFQFSEKKDILSAPTVLCWVNLPGVSYYAELISLGYHTPASHLLKLLSKSLWGIIPQRVNLPGVSYCAESISLGNHTLESQLRPAKIWLPRVLYPWESKQGALNLVLLLQHLLYIHTRTHIYFPGRDYGTIQTDLNSFSITWLTSSKLHDFNNFF